MPQDMLTVLILVGLVGAGKSTFAEALQAHRPEWVRCNQDTLKTRRKVEKLVRQSLNDGLNVCIDRTNVDEKQRSTWINIGREFGASVWCLEFDTPVPECEERLKTRVDHPTINSPERGLKVLSQFQDQYEPPSVEEGLQKIVKFSAISHSSPSYTVKDIDDIIRAFRDPPVDNHVSDFVG